MTREELRQAYHKLNTGRRKQYFFQFDRAGLGSALTLAWSIMYFCLLNGIEFRLIRAIIGGGWRHQRSWDDYFVPFCRDAVMLADRFNDHTRKWRNPLLSPIIEDSTVRQIMHILRMQTPFIDWRHATLWHDVWEPEKSAEKEIRQCRSVKERIHLPQLGMNTTHPRWHCMHILADLSYVPNQKASEWIQQQNAEFLPAESYIGVHIRRGDKVTEVPLQPAKAYIDKLLAVAPHTKKVFIATDDYTAYEEFTAECPPEWEVHTSCPKDSRGHDQNKFGSMPKEERIKAIFHLMAEIDMLRHSELFLGTYSSGTTRIVALLRDFRNCHSLDRAQYLGGVPNNPDQT